LIYLAGLLRFNSPDKVIELVKPGGGLSNLESRQALNQAIEIGSGGAFLSLTEDQYRKLMMNPKPCPRRSSLGTHL